MEDTRPGLICGGVTTVATNEKSDSDKKKDPDSWAVRQLLENRCRDALDLRMSELSTNNYQASVSLISIMEQLENLDE